MTVKKNIIVICLTLIFSYQNKGVAQNTVQQDSIYKDLVLGQFNYKNNKYFIKVNTEHASKTIYLNTEVYDAFCKMYNQAKADGIDLKIISGTRNFYEQKAIWDRKWQKYKNLEPLTRAKKILEYSSMPSTSRHHWGTDVDLNSLRNSYFETGQGKKEFEWLGNNANEYGFHQVYTTKETGRTGYNLEKWHWSYLPIASKYLDFYNNNNTYKDISNFEGCELAEALHIITNYVNGISEQIKDMPITH